MCVPGGAALWLEKRRPWHCLPCRCRWGRRRRGWSVARCANGRRPWRLVRGDLTALHPGGGRVYEGARSRGLIGVEAEVCRQLSDQLGDLLHVLPTLALQRTPGRVGAAPGREAAASRSRCCTFRRSFIAPSSSASWVPCAGPPTRGVRGIPSVGLVRFVGDIVRREKCMTHAVAATGVIY